MYCPECGTRLDDDALFCPECGTKVMHEEEPVAAQNNPGSSSSGSSSTGSSSTGTMSGGTTERVPNGPSAPAEEADTRPVFARGLILTNLAGIGKRLRIDPLALRGIINNYIEALKNIGLSYRLIDASDYTYERKNLFGQRKTVHLTGSDPWYAFADLTLDQHEWEQKNGMDESEYLFIIGGNKDVPMPTLPNFLASHAKAGSRDKTMDTDLLYSYPYGQKMEEDLMSQRLFRYDALFYVGRLPLADNATLEDLTGYLDRSIQLDCSVPVGMAYTQCDPHWKEVTNVITSPMYECGLYPQYNAAPEEVLHRGHIFLTPYVMLDEDDMQPNFGGEFAYIFFNMHGGDSMGSYHYYGVDMSGQHCCAGFSPRLIASSVRPNILFTQACYGGRFIGYPKEYSMLLTAISSMTMVFVGSSRTAYGAGDGDGHLSTSDVLGAVFNQHMMAGESAGQAMLAARMATFKNRPGEPTHALTIAEFNLYGDPMMHFAVDGASFYTAHVSKAAPLGANDPLNVPTEEILMNKNAGEPQSMLAQLRQAVDSNIMKIHEVISKQLYAQYGIPPREPLIISRKTYPDGHRELGYDYPMTNVPDGDNAMAMVTTDEKGEILSVITTK